MAWRDAASAGVLALVAVVGLVQAARLDVGTPTRPGPGFFPLVLAAALLLASTVLAARARRAPADATPAPPGRPARPGALLAAVGGFAAYVALFEPLGFLLATTGFLAFLFGAVARYRWPLALGLAVGLAVAAHLLFDTWLQVRLPPGPLGR